MYEDCQNVSKRIFYDQKSIITEVFETGYIGFYAYGNYNKTINIYLCINNYYSTKLH